MSYLCEMENIGLVLVGRVVNTEFESVEAIEAAADAVAAEAAKHKLPISFVYCGTTINWPDDFEYTACLVGLVTHEHWGDDEEEALPVPAKAFEKVEIPEAFWTGLAESTSMTFSGSDATYLAVAGWTWTSICGADGERIVGADSEGSGYTQIDSYDRLTSGEALTMRASYC